jgi:hypothetical protein
MDQQYFNNLIIQKKKEVKSILKNKKGIKIGKTHDKAERLDNYENQYDGIEEVYRSKNQSYVANLEKELIKILKEKNPERTINDNVGGG